MPVYRIKFVGEAVVEAPNVAKAAKLAEEYRIIGTSLGGRWDRNNRDPWRYEKHAAWLKPSLPEKIELTALLPQEDAY